MKTKEIKFGAAISLTGRYSSQGVQAFRGLTLWTKDVNDLGGIYVRGLDKRLSLKLVHYDDKSQAEECAKLVEKLIVEDEVDILIGPYSSGLSLAALPIAEKYKKTLWNHGGASDEIFEQGSGHIVSIIAPASTYLGTVTDMVKEIDAEAKSVFILHADTGFSNTVAKGARSRAEKIGFEVIYEVKYPSGKENFSDLLKGLGNKNPDLILGVGRIENDLALARGIIEHRVNAKAIALVIASVKEFKKAIGKNVEGFLAPSQWEPGARYRIDFGPTPMEFYRKYKDSFEEEPDYTAAQGYAIGLVAQKCIEEAGALEKNKLREVANKLEFTTFYGGFQIDPSTGRQIAHRVVIVQWQSGKKVVVYPEKEAEAPPLYPKPSFSRGTLQRAPT